MRTRILFLSTVLILPLAVSGCGTRATEKAEKGEAASEPAAPSPEAAPAERTGMVAVGDEAPDFSLPASNGQQITLSSFRGRPVVLYFYPKDDTPGCTTEACAFRDTIDEFTREGVVVLGVSLDDVESHRAFAGKYGLPFPLLADTTGAVASLYGVLGEYRPPEGEPITIARRVTFLIDAEGVVRRIWLDVDPSSHAPEVLAAVRALGEERPAA